MSSAGRRCNSRRTRRSSTSRQTDSVAWAESESWSRSRSSRSWSRLSRSWCGGGGRRRGRGAHIRVGDESGDQRGRVGSAETGRGVVPDGGARAGRDVVERARRSGVEVGQGLGRPVESSLAAQSPTLIGGGDQARPDRTRQAGSTNLNPTAPGDRVDRDAGVRVGVERHVGRRAEAG